MTAFCRWLAATPLSMALQTHSWMVAALQTIHILAIAVALSSAILIDLRLWRLAEREMTIEQVTRRFLPAIWPALLVLLATGSLMIVGEPRRALLNQTFYIKMAAVLLAIGVTLILRQTVAADPDFWQATRGRRAFCKGGAALSILLWAGIILAGRWIAYSGVL